jgi:hypothetical protein
VERHSGGGEKDRYPELVRDVVISNPEVILSGSARLVGMFRAETTRILIVCNVSDPVAWEIVPKLARPGGTITGVAADAGIEIQGKYLQILQETTGARTRLGYLSAVDLKGKNRLAVRDSSMHTSRFCHCRGPTPITLTSTVHRGVSDAAVRHARACSQPSGCARSPYRTGFRSAPRPRCPSVWRRRYRPIEHRVARRRADEIERRCLATGY